MHTASDLALLRIDESIDSLDEKTDMKRVTQEELQRKTAHYQSRMNQLSEVDQNNVSCWVYHHYDIIYI